MEVRVLGPLEVVVAGAVVTVGRAAERALLALLALEPGRVVSADRLIDELWRGQLPEDPGNALQVRVSKLRRALRTAGAPHEVLVTRPPGYLLDIEADGVDAKRFVGLIERARRRASTDAREAERLYGEAAGLWRGVPLAEFDQGWAQAERRRLEALHLTLLEERLELRLTTGRHTEVLADLEQLIAAHPLHERFRAQQMLALYRSGRQADALDVYEDLRGVLSDELGLDPSPEVTAMRDAILRQADEVGAPDQEPESFRPEPLPARLSSMVGRNDDLAHIGDLVSSQRLVTLTGPGGAGKTTLATEAARALTARFPDGVALVELAGVSDPERVPAVVADILRLAGESGGQDPTRLLGRSIGDRELLLVLDNCEHVIAAAATLVEALLTACPRLHVLATSRESLAVPGEIQRPVRPLPVPPADAPSDEVAASDAVQLFGERARAANPTFCLDDTTVAVVAEICRRLDGLPLALELAAARVGALTVAQVAARLSDRFALLSTGPRTAAARQRTLLATVDWSHELLEADEQVLLRRLAVFRGGWTLEAAEAVCSGPPLAQGRVLDLLSRLVARSLVVADLEEGGRYRMLETLRAYALERLEGSGEMPAVRRRHAEHMMAVAEQAAVALRTRAQHAWFHRLRDERDNIDAALAWAVDHASDQPDVGLRLVGALGWWWFFGRHDEGRRWVDRILGAAVGGSEAAQAAALQAASLVWRPGACVLHPSDRCARAAAKSLATAEAAGDARLAAYARMLVAVEAVAGADVEEAEQLLGRAEEVLTEAADDWGLALAAFVRAEIGFRRSTMPFAEAERLAARAGGTFERLGDTWGHSAVLAHHAAALHLAGRLDESVAVGQQALALAEELGLLLTVQWLQAELAYCLVLLGDTEQGLRLCEAAIATTRRLGAGPGEAWATVVQALTARRAGDLHQAGRLSRRAGETLASMGIGWAAAHALSQAGFAAELDDDLATAEALHREALETALQGGEAGLPAAMEGLAAVAVRRDDAETAARLLGCASAVRQRLGHPADAFAQEDIDRAATAARRQLGRAAYQASFDAGAADHDAIAASTSKRDARRAGTSPASKPATAATPR